MMRQFAADLVSQGVLNRMSPLPINGASEDLSTYSVCEASKGSVCFNDFLRSVTVKGIQPKEARIGENAMFHVPNSKRGEVKTICMQRA